MTSKFRIEYKNGCVDEITCDEDGYTETRYNIMLVNKFGFHYTISKSIIERFYKITKRKKEEIKL